MLIIFSQKLQKHEIESIKGSEQCIKRFLTTYDMQLNFYGVKVVNRETGIFFTIS